MTLIVELVGPAGAGKSTLAQHVAARDGRVRTGISVWGLPRTHLLVSAIALLPTIVAAALGGHPLRWAEFAQMVRLGALRRAVRHMARAHRAIVLDEGPVFALSWLDVFFGRNGDPGYAAWRRRTLAAWARLLDVVVLLDATDPALAHRIRTRAKAHPVKHLADDEIYDFTAGFRRAFERVVTDLAAAGALTVDTLDTEGLPPDLGADRLLTTLETACHGR